MSIVDERKSVTFGGVTFENNKLDCWEHSNLLAAKAEGSKRAGEILIDKRRYFLGCMKRKGGVSKVSN